MTTAELGRADASRDGGVAGGPVDRAALEARAAALEAEVAGLRRALETRDPICYAVGILAARAQCSPQEAWRLLLSLSQRRNVRVRDLAAAVLDAHAAGQEPLDTDAAARVTAVLARAERG